MQLNNQNMKCFYMYAYAYWTCRPVANTHGVTVNQLVQVLNYIINTSREDRLSTNKQLASLCVLFMLQ